MKPKTKSTVNLILKIALAIGLIAYMVKSGHLDPKDLWSLMTPLNVLGALAIVGVSLAIATWRWVLLMRTRGLVISVWYGFQLYLIGIFFNHALPGSVGGDVVRGYYLVSDYPGRRADTIMSIVIDRVLGLYSYFILTLIAVACDFEFVSSHPQIRVVASLCLMIFLGMTFFFTVAFSSTLSRLFGIGLLERKIPAVHKIFVAFQRFGDHPKMLVGSILVSVLGQLVTMLFFYQLAMVSGEFDMTWKAVLFAVPMGFLVTALPIAPAGIGVGQVAFSYLFKVYLQKETQFGATAITAYQLTVVGWGIVGAAFYLKRKKPRELATA